jgi:hypothetical protein
MDSRRQYARAPGEFAWGLIGNRLYVAGGSGSSGFVAGIIAAAEVYDFGTKDWREVSSMPVAMLIDAFFVFSGKLFVRGRMPQRNAVEAYSYCPLTNLWEQDDWMLRVLGSARPRPFYNSAFVRDENAMYLVEFSDAFSTEMLYLSVGKLKEKVGASSVRGHVLKVYVPSSGTFQWSCAAVNA